VKHLAAERHLFPKRAGGAIRVGACDVSHGHLPLA
jgi:hypothetical protein